MQQKVILLGLNELNFEFIERYIAQGKLPNFKRLFETYGYKETTSESEYKLLEPWIQWVTVHTGKTYAEHGIFRLGDITSHPELTQLWDIAESRGLKVGAVSPFNARNGLKNPAFFVPDPWTKTPAAGSPLVKQLSQAVSQAVNDNAQEKISKSSLIAMLKGVMKYVSPSRYPYYLKLVASAKKGAGVKAVVLDQYLADVFISEWKSSRPDFASLFLNSGAHIQHHYMFNAAVYDGDQKNPDWYIRKNDDPLIRILECYDGILGRLMALNVRLFVATGLHQNPHRHTTYYWRLKEHAAFLKLLGIDDFEEVVPRMSRDFLVRFRNAEEAKQAEQKLAAVTVDSEGATVFTIDNRGDSLFVELTYDNDITDALRVTSPVLPQPIAMKQYVAFVAIKNGEHNGVGYFIDTARPVGGSKEERPSIPLTQTFHEIVSSFSPAA